jgi:hypothetical protein
MPPQAAGMSCYSAAEEIMPGRADFLVERRGFEMMAIAALGRPTEAFLGGIEAVDKPQAPTVDNHSP